MEKGYAITDEGQMPDAKAARAAGYNLAYYRAIKTRESGGQKDDANVSQNRDLLRAAGMITGSFMDFDWRSGVQAADQANAFGALCRVEDLLPPGIRLWDIKGAPVTNWVAFTSLLADTIYYLDNKVHRKPVIMANVGQINAITSAMASLSQDNKSKFNGCWWGVISWGAAAPVLAAPWTKYPLWISTNHIVSIPGAQNVGMLEWPSTLIQLITWCKNPTMDNLPAWGAVVVEDPPEEEEPPAEEVTLETVSAQLTTLQASLDALAVHLGGK